MILILGLIILIVAAIVGLAGIFGNTGAGHSLGTGGDFSVFGYHATASTGALFLSGIIVGAVALLGLALVLIGARHSARRSARTRRGLSASRRQTAVDDRESGDLVEPRDDVRSDDVRSDVSPPKTSASRGRGHWFGHSAAPR
ncbi:hypothetical protein ACFV0T_35650 [Streptomyces sp. NPDC059582]|uniref:hypothetical protein n=1 Tax=Streptomyces sp. NPDC059582 TaxID=3346875 RepID=UPI0036CB2403